MSEQGSGAEMRDRLSQPTPSWGELRQQVNHADKAYEFLNSSAFNGDPQVTKAMIEAATVHATLFLADKVEELITAMRVCTNQVLDSQERLNENVKTAALALHKDAQELKHLRLVEDEAA